MARGSNRDHPARRVQRRLGKAERAERGAKALWERFIKALKLEVAAEIRDQRIALRRKLNGDTR